MKDACIVPECSRPQECRGLCNVCRSAAYTMVRAGEITEAELIGAGLILPSKARGVSAFRAAAKKITSVE